MNKPTTHTKAAGFTILELMVATSIFAVVLLVLTAGVLSFTRDYFASITRSSTQAVARSLIEDIARTVQFGVSAPTTPSTNGATTAICIDNVMYSYAIGQEVADVTNALKHQSKLGVVKKIPAAGCSAPADITSAGYVFASTDRELLAKHMRLTKLSITPLGDNTYAIRVRVAYGDDEAFGLSAAPADWSTIACRSGAGSQFCAVSDLTTTVQQRITR